ncbi:MAG TPA: GNAT family N-acetyltransferase [Adhaeribacter sp.]|nr:GNAT family N-acetyltransferase [Adhaeribacter sp.]
MHHKLNPDLNTIDWKQIADLIEKVGWSDRDPEDIKVSFQRSSYKVFVYNDQDQIIAFGRTVDDGRFYAQLADIIVDPDHQGENLGELVVETLTDQLKDYHFITLTSATEKADMFYRHLGWKKQSTAFIYPLSEKQIRLHVEPGE